MNQNKGASTRKQEAVRLGEMVKKLGIARISQMIEGKYINDEF